MSEVLRMDGRTGEGGGQILRSSLTLSAASGRPFAIEYIRGGRKKPGLLRQHLTCVRAIAEICNAQVEGAELKSQALAVTPGVVRPGAYRFAVGSAGSCVLVLQTVLVPLLLAEGSSEIVLEGGTHNPAAPPFDALQASFAPLVAQMGGRLELELVRPGFYPAGGGELRVRIDPIVRGRVLQLLERGPARAHSARILTAQLPDDIQVKQHELVRARMPFLGERVELVDCSDSRGPGNAISVHLKFRDVTEVVTAFGYRGVSSSRIVGGLKRSVQRYLESGVPVGEHLADQLMLPMALGAGGSYRTLNPSLHTRTNAEVVNRFLGDGSVVLGEDDSRSWRVDVRPWVGSQTRSA